MAKELVATEKLEKFSGDNHVSLDAPEAKAKLIYSGRSFCPSCKRVVRARLVSKDNFIYIIKECAFENKTFENLIQKGSFAGLNEIKSRIPSHWPVATKSLPLGYLKSTDDHVAELGIKNIQHVVFAVLLVTDRCNLGCKICFRKSSPARKDMEISQIKRILGNFKGKMIVLLGGEPTVREDLPEIISLVKKSGNFPVLFSNGLKLSEPAYTTSLKKAGLKTILLSLDSFSHAQEAQIRGISRYAYDKKIKALENLVTEKFNIRINATILKGVNEDQVSQLIDYALGHTEVSELFFRPLCLKGNQEWAGFDKTSLLSPTEIMNAVCRHLKLEEEYFLAWDELKWAAANYLDGKLPALKSPQFFSGQIYLKRTKNGQLSLFDLKTIKGLTEALKNNRPQDALSVILRSKKMSYLWELFRRIHQGSAVAESADFTKNVLRISVRGLVGESLYLLPDSRSPIDNIKYFSDGKVAVSFNNSSLWPTLGAFFE